MIYVILTF